VETVMVKSIGNLVANLRTDDKVSYKTRAKFADRSALPGGGPTPVPVAPVKKPAKYKTRKKK
jgi:hypothetical protein